MFFLLVTIYILLPAAALFLLFRKRHRNFFKWLLETIFCGVVIFNLFFIGLWSLTFGEYLRYLYVILFLLLSIRACYFIDKPFPKKLEIKAILVASFQILLICVMGIDIISVVKGFNSPERPISLEFPLKGGEYSVVHGGSCELINHHFSVPGQRYALDIVALNKFGFHSTKWFPKQLTDFCIYDTTVYSPCEGTVLEATDLYEDLTPGKMDPEHPAGNSIAILDGKSNAVIILAHLKSGSLQVKKGDILYKGQPLAAVGNSGNTSVPHLHIHAILKDSGDFLFTGKGLPIAFEDRFLVRNSRVGKK